MATILVVDDEEAIRELIKDVLVEQQHTVDQACSGAEAITAVGAKAYDLMIIDRNMPVMGGMQAVQTLRADPRFKTLKIIMCTSAQVMGEIEEAFSIGVTDYIIKPVRIDALISKVKKTLAA